MASVADTAESVVIQAREEDNVLQIHELTKGNRKGNIDNTDGECFFYPPIVGNVAYEDKKKAEIGGQVNEQNTEKQSQDAKSKFTFKIANPEVESESHNEDAVNDVEEAKEGVSEMDAHIFNHENLHGDQAAEMLACVPEEMARNEAKETSSLDSEEIVEETKCLQETGSEVGSSEKSNVVNKEEKTEPDSVDSNAAQSLLSKTASEVTGNDTPLNGSLQDKAEENSESQDEEKLPPVCQGLAQEQGSVEKERTNGERNVLDAELEKGEESIEETVNKREEEEKKTLEETADIEAVEALEETATHEQDEIKSLVADSENESLVTDNLDKHGIPQGITSEADATEMIGIKDRDVKAEERHESEGEAATIAQILEPEAEKTQDVNDAKGVTGTDTEATALQVDLQDRGDETAKVMVEDTPQDNQLSSSMSIEETYQAKGIEESQEQTSKEESPCAEQSTELTKEENSEKGCSMEIDVPELGKDGLENCTSQTEVEDSDGISDTKANAESFSQSDLAEESSMQKNISEAMTILTDHDNVTSAVTNEGTTENSEDITGKENECNGEKTTSRETSLESSPPVDVLIDETSSDLSPGENGSSAEGCRDNEDNAVISADSEKCSDLNDNDDKITVTTSENATAEIEDKQTDEEKSNIRQETENQTEDVLEEITPDNISNDRIQSAETRDEAAAVEEDHNQENERPHNTTGVAFSEEAAEGPQFNKETQTTDQDAIDADVKHVTEERTYDEDKIQEVNADLLQQCDENITVELDNIDNQEDRKEHELSESTEIHVTNTVKDEEKVSSICEDNDSGDGEGDQEIIVASPIQNECPEGIQEVDVPKEASLEKQLEQTNHGVSEKQNSESADPMDELQCSENPTAGSEERTDSVEADKFAPEESMVKEANIPELKDGTQSFKNEITEEDCLKVVMGERADDAIHDPTGPVENLESAPESIILTEENVSQSEATSRDVNDLDVISTECSVDQSEYKNHTAEDLQINEQSQGRERGNEGEDSQQAIAKEEETDYEVESKDTVVDHPELVDERNACISEDTKEQEIEQSEAQELEDDNSNNGTPNQQTFTAIDAPGKNVDDKMDILRRGESPEMFEQREQVVEFKNATEEIAECHAQEHENPENIDSSIPEEGKKIESVFSDMKDDALEKRGASIETSEEFVQAEGSQVSADVCDQELEISKEIIKEEASKELSASKETSEACVPSEGSEDVCAPELEISKEAIKGEASKELSASTETSEAYVPSEGSQVSEDVHAPELEITKEVVKEEASKELSASPETSEECIPSEESQVSEDACAPELEISKENIKEEVSKELVASTETSEACIPSEGSQVSEDACGPELEISKEVIKEESPTELSASTETSEKCIPSEESQVSEDICAPEHEISKEDIKEEVSKELVASTEASEACIPSERSQVSEDACGPELEISKEVIKEEAPMELSASTETSEECIPSKESQVSEDVCAPEHEISKKDIKEEVSKELVASTETSEGCVQSEGSQFSDGVCTPEVEISKEVIKEEERHNESVGYDDNKMDAVKTEVNVVLSDEQEASVATKTSEDCAPIEETRPLEDFVVPELDIAIGSIKEENQEDITENNEEIFNAEVNNELPEETSLSTTTKASEEFVSLEDAQSCTDGLAEQFDVPKHCNEETQGVEFGQTENLTGNVMSKIKDDFSEEPITSTEENKAYEEGQTFNDVHSPEGDIPREAIREEERQEVHSPDVDGISEEPGQSLEESQSSEDVLATELERENDCIAEEEKYAVYCDQTADKAETVGSESNFDVPEESDLHKLENTSEESTSLETSQTCDDVLDPKVEVDDAEIDSNTETMNEQINSDASEEQGAPMTVETSDECAPSGESQPSEDVHIPESYVPNEEIEENNKLAETVNREVDDSVSKEPGTSLATETSEVCAPLEETQSSEDIVAREFDIPKEDIVEEQSQGITCAESMNDTDEVSREVKDDKSEEPEEPIAAKTSEECAASEECPSFMSPDLDIPKEGNMEDEEEKPEVANDETANKTRTLDAEVKDELPELLDPPTGEKTSEEFAPLEEAHSNEDVHAPEIDIAKDGTDEGKKQTDGAETENLTESMNTETEDTAEEPTCELLEESQPSQDILAIVSDIKDGTEDEEKQEERFKDEMSADDSMKALDASLNTENQLADDRLAPKTEELKDIAAEEVEITSVPESENETTSADKDTQEREITIPAVKEEKLDGSYTEQTTEETYLPKEEIQIELEVANSNFEQSTDLDRKQELVEEVKTMAENGELASETQGADAPLESETERQAERYTCSQESSNEKELESSSESEDTKDRSPQKDSLPEKQERHEPMTSVCEPQSVGNSKLIAEESQSEENIETHESTVCDATNEEGELNEAHNFHDISEPNINVETPIPREEGNNQNASEEMQVIDEIKAAASDEQRVHPENESASKINDNMSVAKDHVESGPVDKLAEEYSSDSVESNEDSITLSEANRAENEGITEEVEGHDPESDAELGISLESDTIGKEAEKECQQDASREGTQNEVINQVNSMDLKVVSRGLPSEETACEQDRVEVQKDGIAGEVTGFDASHISNSGKEEEVVSQGDEEGYPSSAETNQQTYIGVEVNKTETNDTEHQLNNVSTEVKRIDDTVSEDKNEVINEELKESLQEELNVPDTATKAEEETPPEEIEKPDVITGDFHAPMVDIDNEEHQVVASYDNKEETSSPEHQLQATDAKARDISSTAQTESLSTEEAEDATKSHQLEHKPRDANQPTENLNVDEIDVSDVTPSPINTLDAEEVTAADIIASHICLALETEEQEQVQQLSSEQLEDHHEATTPVTNTDNNIADDEVLKEVKTNDNSALQNETSRESEICTDGLPREYQNDDEVKAENKSGGTSNDSNQIESVTQPFSEENLGSSCKVSHQTDCHEKMPELHGEELTKLEESDSENRHSKSTDIDEQKSELTFEAREAAISDATKEVEQKDSQGASSLDKETTAQSHPEDKQVSGRSLEEENIIMMSGTTEFKDEKVLSCNDPKLEPKSLPTVGSPDKTEKAMPADEQEIPKFSVPSVAGQTNESTGKECYIFPDIPKSQASPVVLVTLAKTERKEENPLANGADHASNVTDGKQGEVHTEIKQETEEGLSEKRGVTIEDDKEKDSLETEQMGNMRKNDNADKEPTLISCTAVTCEMAKNKLEDGNQTAVKEATLEADDAMAEKPKTDNEKEDEGSEQTHEDSDWNVPLITEEISRDMDLKATHKKQHNILSGVGSKVKHSISKVKKAMTCTSSQFSQEDVIIKLNKNKKN